METSMALSDKINEWLEWDKNDNTKSEVKKLLTAGDNEKLEKLLLARLEFGTAGLRGRMGPGYSQMNDLVIIQTSQGLASYIRSCNDQSTKQGVVIGFDGRHNSRRFAELASLAFLQKDIPVYLYSQLCPTPFVPFAVNLFGCAAGVMVTASHNPKDDNGYKVYWENAAQIISPHDKNIQNSILNNLTPWEKAWDTSSLQSYPSLQDPLSKVMKEYYAKLSEGVHDRHSNESSSTKIVYTAMHGVGYTYMVEAFKVAGFKPFVSVKEQQDPDPEFSTVDFPNPEEGQSALDLAFQTADREGCTLILANDPDSDRLAAAEQGPGGEWHVFSGNELGALLGWWTLYSYRTKNPKADMSKIYMLASTVSSKLLRSMAKKEGFNFVETLTGFKWMGNKAIELEAQGNTVLFAYEEAIGFMCGTTVVDKDGISAAVRAAELVAYLDQEGSTLLKKLNEIYTQYGYHISLNSYYLCYDPVTIKTLFDKLRTIEGKTDSYPQSILNGKYKIVGVRDLTTGFDSTQPDNKAILPVSRSSQMITLEFENGLVTTLRTSGTEPKIKYYTELCASPQQQDKEALHKILQEMVDAICNELLQPSVYGLKPRPT
ncbi:phosphopentomutase [Neocloeon triangulifer]|uniref:phosphopentomutase n=1 Tax=Neocloeon triangulifer TaxID=2078957 RepID=UPI00286EEDB9|nr:phosphopentomutase [Neocloeon triangulifer]